MSKLQHIVHRLRETKVLQNYSYMSALSICSALIGVLLYPYLIRVLGAEQMGTYAFLLGIVMYLQALIEFGFDMPSVKAVSLAAGRADELDRIVSVSMACRALMLLIASALFVPLLLIPLLRPHAPLLLILFGQAAYSVLFPQWYYQGTKNMRFASILQLLMRLSQVPLIIWLVRSADDLMAYASIVSGTMVAGGAVALINLRREGRRWVRVEWAAMRQLFHDAMPFFLTNVSSTIKERTLTTLIGAFLGMREVAIYDLASKVVMLPRLLINSINGALFPEVVGRATADRVSRILRGERLIGVCAMAGVAALGYPLVWLLGGAEMLAAYPVALVMSFTIYSYLVVGAYLQFVFIARGIYRVVAINQVVAMLSCIGLCAVGMLLFASAHVAAAALALSGVAEIVYCRYMCKSIE